MEVIRYTTTLKACGEEYEKIVFWNRFIRNKTELILSLIPAVISIILFISGIHTTFFLLFYMICFLYPIFIYRQFKHTVAYHLKHRDPSESAPCDITFMENGLLAEINEYDIKYVYKWDDFTTIYDKLGYYMMFHKGTMIVMLRKDDIPPDLRTAAVDFMKKYVNQNTCLLKFQNN